MSLARWAVQGPVTTMQGEGAAAAGLRVVQGRWVVSWAPGPEPLS